MEPLAIANYYVSVIQENRTLLAQDLFCDIIDELKRLNVISDEEFSTLMGKEYVSAEKFHEVADKLLGMLVGKPPSSIIKFVKLLKPNYLWLYNLFDDEQINECLLFGGVPALPKFLAHRKELLKKIRSTLSVLKRGRFVVLLGMPGSGKTTLASHCLRDADLLASFNNSVLWVSANYDDVSLIQANINLLLKNKVQLSGDTNIDRLQIVQALRGNECLMILDDVQKPSLVEALNIGCKILITARDRTVMKGFEAVTEFIDVENSFTLDETLSLFRLAISNNNDDYKLPYDATSIHTLSRGFPLTVSLLVGILEDNKESALHNNSPIWKTLKNLLEKKQYGALKRSSFGNELGKNQLNHVISGAVENIGESFQDFFNYFALFVEDINIKLEVFCTLWDLEEQDAQDILLHFVKKSLIVRKWVDKNYVYGIHDILLNYLKKEKLTDADKLELHKKLIERYTAKCPDGDLSKLPQNDNYIFYYIGRHLVKAKEINKLIDLYTNLEFIDAKLKFTGPADLLTDYNKYLKGVEKQADTNKIREIKKFIEVCGRDLNCLEKRGESSDIVQFILQETHSSSFLYKAALQLAAKRQNKSYIDFPIGPFVKGNEPSGILHQSSCVTAMKTTLMKDIIIIGYDNGSLCLYNTETKSCKLKYAGHENGPVKGIALNRDNSFFLSYSLDKRISLWRLFDPQDDFNFNVNDEPRTPSPLTIQENHSPLWQSKAPVSFKNLHHPGDVLCAVYGQNPSLIASSTINSLTVWKDYEVLWLKTMYNVHSCLFCKNDNVVLAGSDMITGFSADFGVILFETPLPIKLSTHSSVISLLMNPVHFVENVEDVLVTTQDVISLWSFACTKKEFKVFHPVNQYRYYQLADIGKYIAVAYADSEIEIFEKDSAASLGLFHNHKGEVTCICLSSDKLYAAYSDNTICVWPLSEINNSIDTLPLDPVSISWVDGAPHIASFSKNNSILVKKERKLLVEIPDVHDVHLIKLSDDSKFVSYCHENYLSRSFIEYPHPSTNSFDSRPSVLNVYMHHDQYMVLAAEGAKLLVWCENKMTFRGQHNVKIQNACLLSGSILCILVNGSVEEYKVDDPSYSRCIHQGDSKSSVYLSETSAKNHIAVASNKGGVHVLTVYNPFEVVLNEVLLCSCHSVKFSPNLMYMAALLPEKQCVWVWKDLKGKSKLEIKTPGVIDGAIAVSNDGSICIRSKESIYCLATAYNNTSNIWAKAFMRTDRPIVSASPTEACLFATVNSCPVLHTIKPLKVTQQ